MRKKPIKPPSMRSGRRKKELPPVISKPEGSLRNWGFNEIPRIWFFTPYSFNRDIGKAYNDYMKLIPNDEDWGCVMDGDICFLMPDWGHQIQQAVIDNPNAGIITCLTNRISCIKQRFGEDSPNMLIHKRTAQQRYNVATGRYSEVFYNIGGFLMCIKKSVWKKVKFPEHPGRILDVDTIYSRRMISANKKLIVMDGMFVFHYYRLAEGKHDKSHLKRQKTHFK